MPDFDESLWKNMHEESSDKFFMPKGELFFRVGFVVLHPKNNRFVADLKDPGVADGDPMRISAQILKSPDPRI